jgi:telomerase reverse transcriptase
VQACFDTIPQGAVLRVVKELLSTSEYLVANEACVKVPEATTLQKGEQSMRPVVKFTSNAKSADDMSFGSTNGAVSGNSVLVKPLGQQSYRRQQIENMITEHVEFNLIKIGKKYYRQKKGIPQGSVLSSLLCNFFYGKLEREELQFLEQEDTCLLRLIDDFLLITPNKQLAERFLQRMHQGLPEYGVSVKPAKSLVSFDCSIGVDAVPRCEESAFPYCGLMIDMTNLDLTKSGSLKAGTTVSDSLTVEYSNAPGQTFRRKTLK